MTHNKKQILSWIKRNIERGDVGNIAKLCGKSEVLVRCVLYGRRENALVFASLLAKAQENARAKKATNKNIQRILEREAKNAAV